MVENFSKLMKFVVFNENEDKIFKVYCEYILATYNTGMIDEKQISIDETKRELKEEKKEEEEIKVEKKEEKTKKNYNQNNLLFLPRQTNILNNNYRNNQYTYSFILQQQNNTYYNGTQNQNYM